MITPLSTVDVPVSATTYTLSVQGLSAIPKIPPFIPPFVQVPCVDPSEVFSTSTDGEFIPATYSLSPLALTVMYPGVAIAEDMFHDAVSAPVEVSRTLILPWVSMLM